MKIMMIITGMRSGGAERVMATLCNELSKKHYVRLVVIKEAKSDYYISDGVELVSGNIIGQNALKSIFFVKKQIEIWKPDVAVSFMTKTNIISLLSRMISKWKAKLVIAERANPYYAKRYLKAIRRVLYPIADGCVFQTKQAQAYYERWVRGKCVVLRNPLNPDFKVDMYDGERVTKIVSVGRLSKEKNHELLIDAFAEIANEYPEYFVEIYGDGPLRGYLEKKIADAKLTDRVFLKGRIDNIQLYIRDASCFVLSSDSEGMPNALLEAMALGIPSIATDCPIGGPAFIISDCKNGLLIPTNDKNQMKKSIKRILDDSDLAHSISLECVKVKDDYSVGEVCRQWEEYLVSLA